MEFWIIAGIAHLVLCIVAGICCHKAKETETALMWGAFFVPFVGPALLISAYLWYKSAHLENEKTNKHTTDETHTA